MQIDILVLNEPHIPKVKGLIAGYKNSSSNGINQSGFSQDQIENCEQNKACRLQLETDDDNIPARTLYTNLGFNLIQGKGVYMSFL